MQLPAILCYDGSIPAPSTTGLNVSRGVTPPLRGDPMRRDPLTLAAVINQFAVAVNPRYEPRDTSGDGRRDTHCDRFADDVCDALGAVLPDWVDVHGNPCSPGHGRELNANGTNLWLDLHGARFGWRPVQRSEAQQLANQGHPVLVTWRNPEGPGHIAVVRPAEEEASGPVIAQAGAKRFNRGTVAQGFGDRPVRFWANDTGGTVSASGQWTPPAALVEQALADLQQAAPEVLALAAVLFQRLTARQGQRSAVSGVKLPDFDGCSPLVRADWLDVARFVADVAERSRTTGLSSTVASLLEAAQQKPGGVA
jgi:hypothetical protein